MPKNPRTLRDILTHLREIGVDEVIFNDRDEDSSEKISITKSLEAGKIQIYEVQHAESYSDKKRS